MKRTLLNLSPTYLTRAVAQIYGFGNRSFTFHAPWVRWGRTAVQPWEKE